jgi:hypothetical protein
MFVIQSDGPSAISDAEILTDLASQVGAFMHHKSELLDLNSAQIDIQFFLMMISKIA